MIKNEGFLSKLEPKFGGPYKVVRRTKYNNYELVDTNNTPLKRAIPVHKLREKFGNYHYSFKTIDCNC